MKLKDHPLFTAFNPEQSQDLIARAQTKDYKQGELIFEEGAPADDLYIILKGEIVFSKVLDNDKLQEISTSSEGEMLGEIGVITKQPRSLRASAKKDSKLAILPGEVFTETIGGSTAGPLGPIFKGIISHLNLTTDHYLNDILEKEKMAMVGKMINGLIHDFKNPFSIINMSAQLIAGEHSDDLTQELCENIENQISHMLEMAGEISEFSKGKQHLTVSACNLKNLLDRFMELNPLLAKNDNISINIDIEDIIIEAEDIKLLRVMQNLITNAVDAFKDNSSINNTINISAKDIDNNVEIIIKDNGSGIPEEIRDTFFKPFVTFGKEKGTGLGTAIVKSIIESHHGHIKVDTDTNKGTTFTITLPKQQPLDTHRV